mmetsp:Transcript_61587/g.143318  ORF Transcript_61587/g.143318 Transcript_61587/m.143318 type:complete len:109 (+) Transcript_61587:141-467(+)
MVSCYLMLSRCPGNQWQGQHSPVLGWATQGMLQWRTLLKARWLTRPRQRWPLPTRRKGVQWLHTQRRGTRCRRNHKAVGDVEGALEQQPTEKREQSTRKVMACTEHEC